MLQRDIARNYLLLLDKVFDADYYVDALNGSDAFDGLSETTAKATIAAAIALASSGQTIAVMRSSIYYQTSMQTVPAGVTLRNYPGFTPILSFAKLRTGWSATGGQTITYEIATADTINTCWQDTATLLTSRASIALVDANPGSWYSDGAKLYVSMSDSSDPAGHTVETVQNASGNAVVALANGSKIQGLIIQHGPDNGVQCTAAGSVTIQDCTVRHNRNFNMRGLQINAAVTVNSSGSTYHDAAALVRVQGGCTVNSTGDTFSKGTTGSFVVGTGTNVVNFINPTVTLCTCNPAIDIQSNWTLTGTLKANSNTSNGVITRFSNQTFSASIYSNGGYGLQCFSGDTVTLKDAVIHDNTGAGVLGAATNFTIKDGTVYSNGGDGIGPTGANAKVLRCISHDNGGIQISVTGASSLIEGCLGYGGGAGHIIYVKVGADDSVVRLCRAYGADMGYNGIYVNATDCIAEYNASYDNASYGTEFEEANGAIMRYGIAINNNTGHILKTSSMGTAAPVAQYNISVGGVTGMLDKASVGATWQNNIAKSVSGRGMWLQAEAPDNTSNCTFNSNTIDTAAYGIGVDSGQDTGFSSDNNHFVSCTKVGDWLGTDETTLANWQTASSQDASSDITAQTGSATYVKKAANADGNGYYLGWVLVQNWDDADTVSADLTALGLTLNNTYRIRNALTSGDESTTFVYDGGNVSIPMTGWTVDGATDPFPTFGAFLIENP